MGRLHYEDLPFVNYCYQRKNLKGNPNIEQIGSYINALWLSNEEIKKLKSFQVFKEEFFSRSNTVFVNKNA